MISTVPNARPKMIAMAMGSHIAPLPNHSGNSPLTVVAVVSKIGRDGASSLRRGTPPLPISRSSRQRSARAVESREVISGMEAKLKHRPESARRTSPCQLGRLNSKLPQELSQVRRLRGETTRTLREGNARHGVRWLPYVMVCLAFKSLASTMRTSVKYARQDGRR